MPKRPRLSHFARHAVVLAAASVLFGSALPAGAAARPDNPPTDIVGAIEGETITVSGPMNVEVVHGQTKTVLRSGSDVRVKSGQARIDLVEGGNIVICGPAHFSVLKSGGALTIALDSGTIHAHIAREPALTVYTAQIQAKPVAIGDGPLDVLAGFDAAGALCIRAGSGAVRIEQQLTGQSVIVPQGGDVLLTNGQLDTLRTTTGHCSCELEVASAPPPPPPPSPEVSGLASPDDIRKKQTETDQPAPQLAPQKPLATEEPIYQVFMPALAYDATAKIQPDFDPKFIVLVRRVRVRPTLIFQGRVEGDPIVMASDTAPHNPAAADPQSNQQTTPKPAATNQNNSMLDRVRTFFRHLWTRSS
ncbi:MAG TPA: hypothetical protein VHF01_01735 [Candidatus Acidoferrum sp.]|nr:hypothetical protein [Candidatus Acidoferrum sp.]